MDPLMVTTVEKDSTTTPLLIIDHKGIIGNAIYETVHKELLTALVSGKHLEDSENLIYIPYKHRIPEIPNGDYAMILLVDNQERDLFDIAKKCIAKAKDDDVPFIFITENQYADRKLLERITEAYEESYVIIVGEFFGQGDTLLDSYILQAGTKRTIKLPHMGLRKSRPILFSDVIHGILQTLFGIEKRHKVTWIFPYHEYTDLSVAHMLQKADPIIHIDFFKDRHNKLRQPQSLAELPDSHYLFGEQYPVQQKILEVYNDLSSKKRI